MIVYSHLFDTMTSILKWLFSHFISWFMGQLFCSLGFRFFWKLESHDIEMCTVKQWNIWSKILAEDIFGFFLDHLTTVKSFRMCKEEEDPGNLCDDQTQTELLLPCKTWFCCFYTYMELVWGYGYSLECHQKGCTPTGLRGNCVTFWRLGADIDGIG